MDIFSQTPVQSILFFILYGISGVVPFLAALYLLLRPYNTFSAGIKPPVRLRRWTAAFFAFTALAHLWWLLFIIFSLDFESLCYQLIVLTDTMLLLTTIAGTMLSMLQDRRRPMWPVLVAMLPFVALFGLYFAFPSDLLKLTIMAYLMLLSVAFAVYMVFAIRRYDRWLNDNYADLEHKRVWLSQVVAFLCMLLFVLYEVSEDMVLFFCLHIVDLVLVFLLLWRVETLPQLEAAATDEEDSLPEPEASQDPATDLQGAGNAAAGTQKPEEEPSTPLALRRGLGAEALSNIGDLLKENCEKTGLYLMNDLTLAQLSAAVGVNRSYLSQYFSCQGMNYNTYINGLRINHFVSLYQKAASSQQYFTAQQLAQQCGYRSYSTFSTAFKQRMGQSVSAWMRETGGGRNPMSRKAAEP